MPTDLLTLTQAACVGTTAEGLAPHMYGSVPYCRDDCPHYRDSTSCAARTGLIVEDVCEPAVEALARLALSQAAEVDRLTAELAAAKANSSIPSNGCESAVVEVDLVWQQSPRSYYWTLGPAGSAWNAAPYSADRDGQAAVVSTDGHALLRSEQCADLPAACRQIAEWARADDYRVPPHPLGWDVGVKP
jgi:hypothetical protein